MKMELPETIYNDIKNIIITIAEGLKVSSEKVMEVVAKQALVDSITNICLMIFFIILVCVGAHTTRKLSKKENPEGTACCSFAITFVLFIIMFLFIIAHATETITGFVNPEYRVIELILDVFKSK